MSQLITPHGGYIHLDVFLLTCLLQMETLEFCEKYLTRENDPQGRMYDQMTLAARSGRSNIVEGSERSGTSRETEMKLTDVARASIQELMWDYMMWITVHKGSVWTTGSPEAEAVRNWQLDPHPRWRDPLHEVVPYLQAQYQRFHGFTANNDIDAANALILLCRRVTSGLMKLLDLQGKEFLNQGGFRERLTQTRLQARSSSPSDLSSSEESAPSCPDCGKPMRKRTARKGPHAGKDFWSCSGYPECKRTLPIDPPVT